MEPSRIPVSRPRGFLNLTFGDWFLPFWEDYDPFGSDADDGESA